MTTQQLVDRYLKYRHSLGGKFRTHGIVLKAFSKFIGELHAAESITTEQCKTFLYHNQNPITNTWFCRYSALNGMFNWAASRMILAYNPLPTEKPNRVPYCKPHIYSMEELSAMFKACWTYQKGFSKNYPECTRMILMLSYMMGLRLHEAMDLRFSDINLQEGTVYIRESKFFKSRLLPINFQVVDLLKRFIDWRISLGFEIDGETYLFITCYNTHMISHSFEHYFLKILDEAKITRSDGFSRHPRIHDLRHTFAVHRLLSWYKAGENVQVLLPYLSTYLGHKDLNMTTVYLSMTNELLEEASKKFQKYANK